MKKILTINILLVFMLFTGCSNSKLDTVLNNVNENNIEEAIKDYPKLKEDEKSEVNDVIKKVVDEELQKFINKEISPVDAMTEIFKFKKIDGVKDYVEEITEKITVLNKSRENFEKAKSLESQGSIDSSIKMYESIDRSDVENYEVAQQKMEELKVVLEENNKKELAEKMAENNKYSITATNIVANQFDLYDGIQAIIKNNSDTPVKEFIMGIFVYDKNGLPLKVSSLAGGDVYMSIKETNANIMPGETFGADKVVNTYLDFGTVGNVKVSLIEVVDYDGKKWTNPLYSQWYLDNYDKKY